MTRFFIALGVILTAFQTAAVCAEDGPTNDVPELQVLSHYVGAWDVVVTSEAAPFSKGEAAAKWVLDGRFVQQSGRIASADGANTLRITTVMTYDQNEKTYRMWSFLSNGTTTQSTGKWDAKSRTMTSVQRNGDKTTTTTARFTDDGSEEWSIVTRNQNKEVVNEFAGKNTRQKQ